MNFRVNVQLKPVRRNKRRASIELLESKQVPGLKYINSYNTRAQKAVFLSTQTKNDKWLIKSRLWTPEPIVVFSESAYGDGDGEEWSERKKFGAECFFTREAFSKVGS